MLFTLTICSSVFCAPLDDAPKDAKSVAQRILAQGASLFDSRDAASIAATYMENATIVAYSKDNNTLDLKSEVIRDRDAIQKMYANLFRDRSPSARSQNVVEDAHYVGTDVLVIRGSFILDNNAEHKNPIPFVQVRHKKDHNWLIVNLQLFGFGNDWTSE